MSNFYKKSLEIPTHGIHVVFSRITGYTFKMGRMRRQLTLKRSNGHWKCPVFFSVLPLSGPSLVLSWSFPDRLGRWISVTVLDLSLYSKKSAKNNDSLFNLF